MKPLVWILFVTPLAAETVATVPVERRDVLRQSIQPVTAAPFHVAEFGSMVTGYVAEVSADIGDRVKAGQPLARIDVPDIAQLLRSHQAEAKRAATDIEAARGRLNASQAEWERVEALVKTATVTAKAGDEARERLEAAKAELDASEARLTAAQARSAETQAMFDYATLKAPFDGLVIERSVDPGDLVTAAGKAGANGLPLFRVARTDVLRIIAHLPERDALWAHPGDPVTLAFDALPGSALEAKITRVASALDGATQRMRVEIDWPNAEPALPPGLFGRATITLEKREGALVIPATALRASREGPLVYVVKDGRVRHQPVKLGIDDGGFVELTAGVQAGDRVVDGSVDRLADGAAVEVR
jgi:RND family efflux transporter MFP subunit